MKKILLATLAILWLLTGIGGRLVAQENIAVWKFPSNNTAVTCVSDGISESDCSFSAVGNVNTSGTNNPNTLLCDGTDDTKSLQVLGQDGGSVIFKISTSPYRNIVVSYDLRCHPSLGGNPNYAWSYSFDGVSYTNAPASTSVTNFTATTFTTQTADFSSITAMNGKQSVWFKLTMSGATSNVTSNLDNVVFTGIPFTCMAPVNVVAAQNDAVDEAVVSWEPAGTNETSYTVVYYTGAVNQSALSSMASANYNTVANATSPQTITGLEANTTYYIYVRANCGGTDESMWSQAALVTTPRRCTIADLSVSNIGGTTATLSWNTEAAGARVRVFSEPTETPWETSTGLVFEQSVADTFCNVTGMQYSTNYYAYVKSACTERNLSEPISTTFTTAFADNVIDATIGEAETSGYYAPFNNFYRNSWNQSIYTVNEIGHAGTIGTVSWYSASTSTVHFTDLRIYMGLTSMSEASATSSWVPMDDLTLVYSSTDYTVGGNVGWETFYLDTPYEYDGSQNLVVVVAKKTANYSSSCTYRYTAVTNRVLYRQSDSDESYASHPGTATGTRSNNLPNIKFGLGNPYNVCLPVSAIVATNKTDAGFTASWTRGGEETAWMVKYGEAGFDVETEGTLQNVTDTFCVISGLDANTAYDVYVKSACDAQHTSGWTFATITTECGAESVPYAETFENITGTYVIPDCWERVVSYTSGSTVYPYIYSSNAHNGSKCLYMYIPSSSAASENIIALPPVNNLNTLQVSLWARYGSNVPQAFEIGYMRNGEFTAVKSITLTTTYQQYTAYMSSAPADADKIAIRAYHASSYVYVYIDDIEVSTIPSCVAPEAIVASDVTTTSASISWTDILPATAWQYQLNGGEIIDIDSKPINLTGLASNTAYTLNVRTVCENNDYSEWSSVGFRTECGEITIEEGNPYIEGFEEYTGSIYSDANGEIPGCWESSSTGTVRPHIIGSGSYYYVHSGTNALTFYGSGNCYAVLPAFTNDLNTLYLSFWSQMESTSYGTLTLGYITAADVNMNTFTEIETYESATVMTQHSTSLANLPASATRLVFRWYYSSQWSCCIDDLTVRVVSSAAEITAFSFAEDASVAVINNAAASVNSTVSYTTSSLNGLVPTIRVSDFATISPASGVARDFSSPVTYTVTAEDGTTKDWTVTVAKETVASSAKDILSFSFANQIGESVIDTDNHTVSAQIVWNYDLADNITPTITVSPQATISPASGTAQNFTNPVTYTVTAEDASTQTWTVTIITDPSVCVNPLASTFTANELASTYATIAWDKRYQETSYNVKVSSTAMTNLNATADLFDGVVNDTLIALTGLAENTQYYMYVQSTCGAEGWTDYTFRTIVEPATIPYVCGFEDAAENNQWILVNETQTNKWFIGTASNNGGENGLYISNDNGVTNAYTNSSAISFVYAYRTINFPANSDYIVSFDWKAYGEGSYDYIRAWLVPASTVLTAGQLPDGTTSAYSYVSTTPEGWISLDGGSKLNLQSGWQTGELSAVSVPSGKYNVVFLWANDNSGGDNPPASIDNISITQITCPTVANITATATQNTADIAWTERGNATEWAVVVSNAELTEEQLETAEKHIVDAASYLATGLNSNTTYYIYVRANCSTEDVSDWRMKQIRTDCGANVLPYSENFDEYTATAYDAEGTVPYCWNVVFSGSDEGFAPHVTNTDYYQPNSGSKYLVMSVAQNEAEGANAYALMPELMNGYGNTNVSFEYRAGATNRGTFSLGYMVGETYTNLTDITLGSTSKVSFSYSVPSTVPANAILALKLTASGTANLSLGIDNVYVRETSSAAEITAFSFAQDAEDAEIISESATVNSTVSFSTESLEALVPTIAISEYATIEPASGVARDFSAPVTYIVTAEDGTIKEWTVNVTKQTVASSAKDILSFSFNGQRGESVIDTENHTVTAYTEWNYNFSTNITPTITISPLATISPASGIAQNFAVPFTYTVMAEDSTTQEWIVTIAHDPNQCVNPLATSMVVNELSSSSATVAWVKRYDANETLFNVKVSTTAMTDMTATADFFDGVVNDTAIVLTGLSDATTYYVYVQTACGIEAWISKSFQTPCNAIASLPWSEDFNGLSVDNSIPDCWDNSEGTTTTASYRWCYITSTYGGATNGTGHTGNCVRFNSYSNTSGRTSMLKTPAFDLSSYVGASLTFWYKNPAGGDLSVYVSTDGGDTYTNHMIATGLTGVSSWTDTTFDISQYRGNNVVIVFKGTSNWGNDDAYIYLDDVSIDVVTCPAVSAIEASNQTATSATVSWTENGNADNWQFVISETALDDPATGTINNVETTHSYSLTNLTPETDYNVYVRAKCADDDFSDWVPFTLTTPALCPVPANIVASALTETSATITWNGYHATAWDFVYSATRLADPATGNMATVDAASYNMAGLSTATVYYVYVRANCGGDEFSAWTDYSFRTPCGDVTSFPWTEDFENGVDCWTMVDADDDGYGWVAGSATDGIYIDGGNLTGSGHNSSADMLVSGSYSNVSYEALTPDNWAISPTLDLTQMNENEPLKLTYFVKASDASYSEEHYKVCVSTTTSAISSFTTTLLDETLEYGNNNWQERYIDLSSYSGQRIYIAFVHYDVTDQFLIFIDDITVAQPSGENDIISFSVPDMLTVDIDNTNHIVAAEISNTSTQDLSAIVPTITVSDYAEITLVNDSDYTEGVAQDFTSPVVYTVKAENNSTQDWSVTVTRAAAPSSEKDILAFSFAGQVGTSVIDATAHTVSAVANLNVNLANPLTPTIEISPMATISPASGVAQTFAESVVYTVTAEDETTQEWTVTITQDPSSLATLPYACDFEDASENANWVFENGDQTNKWYIGTAANNGGANGLYISNNNGTSNAYDESAESYVYAYRQINVTEAGNYDISFDWRSNGEESYDMLMAFAVPASLAPNFNAGDNNGIEYDYYDGIIIPTGWIDIANPAGELSGVTEWQHSEKTVNLNTGAYNVVFMWQNDASVGDQTPAAVDNIMIAPATFTVTTSHVGLGSISPEGETQVADGGQFQLTVTPMDGFMLESLMVNNVDYADSLVNNVLTLTVHEDLTIVASFDVPHTILASAGVGGTITPEGSVQVGNGESKTFAIASNAGYIISSVIADTLELISEGQELVNFSYTFNNVRDDHTIVATFEVAPSHTILATAGEGGTINPSGTITVLYNGSQTFEFTPNEGYRLSRVMVDTTSNVTTFVENNTYTFNNVIANHSINAEFVANSYNLTVHYVYADNTTAAPDHTESVTFGTAYSVTSPVITGYTADQLVVEGTMPANNVELTVIYNVNSYNLIIHYVYADNTTASPDHTEEVAFGTAYSVTSPVIANYTADQLVVEGTMPSEDVVVTVTYNVNNYNLTIHYVYAENNAEAAPDHTEEVAYGAQYSVVSPVINGYTADQLTVAGTMPAEDVVVTVRYTANPPETYTLTIHYVYATNNATVAPDHIETLEDGASYSVTSPVIDGYTADQLTVAGTMPANDVNVTVRYTENGTTPTTYTIVASTGNGGTITPNGTITVNEGADQSFTITPNAGYRIASVLVDNADATSQLVNGVYTFTNVRANHTIVSTFEPASSTTYTITASAGNGGTITPNNVVTVAEGANQTFRFTPDNGYRIATVVVDGNNVMDEVVDYSYTFYDVRANHTIYVTFTDGDAVDEYTTSSMSVYPNPNNGMFSIDFSRIEGDATYQLIDARGAVVETRDINVMDGDTMNFNHNLRPGSYFVRIITADKVYVEQIVVE